MIKAVFAQTVVRCHYKKKKRQRDMEKTINEYDVDKIVQFLTKYKDNLPKLYKWNVKIDKLFDLEVLTEEDIQLMGNKSPYEKELILKKIIQIKLNEFYSTNKTAFEQLCLWIIKVWGGINVIDDSSTLKLIHDFLSKTKPSFNRIASTSKVGSFMFPEKHFIYDSRVAYALNWIILSENAGTRFFPIPEGRNSKMLAFDMNVLIRLKNIDFYKSSEIEGLNSRLYINNKDKITYVSTKKAYFEMSRLIQTISRQLWTDEKSDVLYYTEMLLFSIADREIFNDITDRIRIEIK